MKVPKCQICLAEPAINCAKCLDIALTGAIGERDALSARVAELEALCARMASKLEFYGDIGQWSDDEDNQLAVSLDCGWEPCDITIGSLRSAGRLAEEARAALAQDGGGDG